MLASFQFLEIARSDIGEVYITDVRWRVYKTDIRVSDDEIQIQRECTEPFFCFVQLTNPKIGKLYLPVWGDEGGYTEGRYSLEEELLRSQISRCRTWAQKGSCPEWDSLDPLAAEALLSSDPKRCYELLADAIVASEELLYHRAVNTRTSVYPVISTTLFGDRKGEYAIGPGPDWPVEQRPDFTRSPQSTKLALDCIGGTTLPNFWRWIEYEQGRYCWKELDAIVAQAAEHNLLLKSFSLYWGGMGGTPPWFRTLQYAEQLTAIERWVKAIVERYKDVVDCWETVNELHNWRGGNPFGWNHDQLLEVTRLVNEQVGSLAPGKKRLINSCCIWGDYVQTGRRSLQWENVPWTATWSPMDYFDQVIERDIDFEAIGIQFYNPARDLATCFQTIEEYARYGKEIQITEMGTPSESAYGEAETGQVDFGGGWRGFWTPEKQGLWVERFFNIVTLAPQVRVLNYWDFDDTTAFVKGAGLVDENQSPKPSYARLLELSRFWKQI